VLEGGYSASGLREGTQAVLEALLPEEPLAAPPRVDPTHSPPLAGLIERVAAVHRSHHPELGAA